MERGVSGCSIACDVKMRWFQTIHRHSILAALDVNSEKLVRPTEDFVWTVIGWLKWLTNRVMVYENIGSIFEGVADRVGRSSTVSRRGCSQSLHPAAESHDVAAGVRSVI